MRPGSGASKRERARENTCKEGATHLRRHQTCDFREHATSAPAELGGKFHICLRIRARTQVLLQARKLHVDGSCTFGSLWQNSTRKTAGVPHPRTWPSGPAIGREKAGLLGVAETSDAAAAAAPGTCSCATSRMAARHAAPGDLRSWYLFGSLPVDAGRARRDPPIVVRGRSVGSPW